MVEALVTGTSCLQMATCGATRVQLQSAASSRDAFVFAIRLLSAGGIHRHHSDEKA